jgi:hypothetical protein
MRRVQSEVAARSNRLLASQMMTHLINPAAGARRNISG